jgi:hypothetical protein
VEQPGLFGPLSTPVLTFGWTTAPLPAESDTIRAM